MKSRSKKYYQTKKEQSGKLKGSLSSAGYNEENELTENQSPKKNPGPGKSKDDPSLESRESQDEPIDTDENE
jgi:hypothetical protein